MNAPVGTQSRAPSTGGNTMPARTKKNAQGATTASAPQGLIPYPHAAAYLSIGPRSLKGLVAAGKVRVVQVSARRVAFRLCDLDAYIASCVR